MKKTITSIVYNWFPPVAEGYTPEWQCAEVGQDGVTLIEENPARGEGDKWHYDIHFEDGRMKRIFNINTVDYLSQPTN